MKKSFMLIAGVVSLVVGIVLAIPSFLKGTYGVATASVALIVLGLILLGIALGD